MEAVFLDESATPSSLIAMDKDISRADLSSQQFSGDKADIRENLRQAQSVLLNHFYTYVGHL